MQSATLRFADGNYVIVLPPPLLDCNHQFHSRLVRLHHLELHQAVAGQIVWPPEEVATTIYNAHSRYFQKVGALLTTAVDTDLLEPISRHLFFVCTDPLTHPELKTIVPGLSQLEQLMGYGYSSGEPQPEPIHTTGNPELDVLVDSLLIFKQRALPLAQMLSLQDLSKACKQANDRMKASTDQADNPAPTVESPWEEPERYKSNKESIDAQIKAWNIWKPDNGKV